MDKKVNDGVVCVCSAVKALKLTGGTLQVSLVKKI